MKKKELLPNGIQIEIRIDFFETPIVNLSDETFACQLDQKEKQIRSIKVETEKIYFAPAGKETKFEPSNCFKYIDDLKTLPFESFD